MIKNDGGPAFPSHAYDTVFPSSGLTLRDYFAAKAMQGFCMNRGSVLYKDAAEEAYRMAAAMLAERDK
jgi:hypothetical protein